MREFRKKTSAANSFTWLAPVRKRAALSALFSLALSTGIAVAQAPAPDRPRPASALPEAALEKAREAENHLKADAPKEAIAILRELDKAHPNTAALSLRLAQIHDTLGQNGYALFYYRRYVAQAGPKARSLAVERVTSLELMAGIAEQVKQAERELGETTRPVTTPAPKVERMLATRAKDGGLVPIRSEKDLEKLEREGVPEKSPVTPVPTSAVTPIILPDSSPAVGSPAPAPAQRSQAQPASSTSYPAQQTPAPQAAAPRQSPATTDEDALLAKAFRKIEVAEEGPAAADATDELKVSATDLAPTVSGDLQNLPPAPPRATTPTPSAAVSAPPPSLSQGQQAPAPVSPHLSASGPSSGIAFTKQTQEYDTPRAASFFQITEDAGNGAVISLINDVPASVATISITPRDDSPVVGAILAPKEQKRVQVKPGTYDVAVNVSTHDYSPITLMNTNFTYTFSAGKKYTRRFNKNNIQQLN